MFRPIRRLPRLLPIPAALITAVLMICALFTQVLLTAVPAQADTITGASPAAGSRLRSAPGAVQLTFDNLVLPGSGTLSVSGPGGQVSQGMTQTIGHSVSRQLGGSLANGTYSVSWSVTILLGSHLSGSYHFAVGPKPAPAVAPTTPKASVTKSPTPKPSASASASVTASRSRAAVATTTPARTTRSAALPVAAGTSSPQVTASAPVVASVSATGTGHLPSPVVLWGLILLLSVLAVMINRWRKGSAGQVRPAGDGSRRLHRGVSPPGTSPVAAGSIASRAAARAAERSGAGSPASPAPAGPGGLAGAATAGSPTTGSMPGTRASRRTAELPTAAQSGLAAAGTGSVPATRRGLRQRPAPIDEEIPGLLPHE